MNHNTLQSGYQNTLALQTQTSNNDLINDKYNTVSERIIPLKFQDDESPVKAKFKDILMPRNKTSSALNKVKFNNTQSSWLTQRSSQGQRCLSLDFRATMNSTDAFKK